jgi:hypothetical protein
VSDTTKKRLKFAGKLLFICLLLGILYYSFRDSMGDMLTELANVSPQVVMSLFLTVILTVIDIGCRQQIASAQLPQTFRIDRIVLKIKAAFFDRSEDTGLELMRPEAFETENSYYRIYLYRVMDNE